MWRKRLLWAVVSVAVHPTEPRPSPTPPWPPLHISSHFPTSRWQAFHGPCCWPSLLGLNLFCLCRPPPPQIHSDSDEGDGSIKYTISGEGAGTIFLIDELTGDIHATERLDREQKTFYTLRAQARDRQTDQLLEPESEFVIKVQDVNDSEPRFLGGPYIGSVAELSPVGESLLVRTGTRPDPQQGCRASTPPLGLAPVQQILLSSFSSHLPK